MKMQLSFCFVKKNDILQQLVRGMLQMLVVFSNENRLAIATFLHHLVCALVQPWVCVKQNRSRDWVAATYTTF